MPNNVVFGGGMLPPEEEPPSLWTGLDMYWTGWNGSRWSLVNPTQGSVMLPGVRGFNMPPITHHADKYASVAGSRWRGYSVDEREVFWPIQIYNDSGSQPWINRDNAWWKTMRPGKPGVWTVIQPTGAERSLTLRFKDDGDQEFSHDPTATGWQNYGITFVAEQPFWEGQAITRTFTASGPVPFFDPNPGSGSVLSLSGSEPGTTVVQNPGDEQVWPTWLIEGPCTGFAVGYGSKVVSGNITVGVGQTLTIETDPVKRSAKLNGLDVMVQLGSRDFAPFPEGDLINVTATVTGTGRARYSFKPLYHRAW